MVDRPQLQAPRGVQASGTNRTSPCTHPSSSRKGGAWKRWMLRFGRHAALRVPGTRHAGESALHERDHRGGDHPIPFRTRQLSPPSPKVLQRQAAGGQGVALMQGASAYPGPFGPFFFLGPQGPFPISGARSTAARRMLAALSRSRSASAPMPSRGPIPTGSRPPSLEPVKRCEHLAQAFRELPSELWGVLLVRNRFSSVSCFVELDTIFP